MRESRTLRAMWRALETGPRHLLNGHEEGNLGYKPRRCLRAAAPVLDPTEATPTTKCNQTWPQRSAWSSRPSSPQRSAMVDSPDFEATQEMKR